MTEDPDALRPVPIPGARPETPHPAARALRGFVELCAIAGQALLALSELVRPRRDDTEPEPKTPQHPRKRPHPVEKAAPFPVND
ncbi:MAG: hypothetical protein JSR98_07635 [Proteobacteria bacterium]|nr:hypothetical protein [Pseudomonadota bacterium]